MRTDKQKRAILITLATGFLIYSFTLYTQPPKSKGPYNARAAAGKLLWQQKNCISCHQLYGLGGHLGPDLTHVTSKRTSAYIEAFVSTGTNTMPAFRLSQQEMDELKAFLAAVDQSGQGDPRTFKLHLDGTISQ